MMTGWPSRAAEAEGRTADLHGGDLDPATRIRRRQQGVEGLARPDR
jgi:hypothetical protein